MERDRSLGLLVRAVSTGQLDLTHYDPADIRQKLKVNWILRDVDMRTVAEMVKVRHAHNCTILTSPKISNESWEELQKQAIKTFDDFKYYSCPWDQPKPDATPAADDNDSIIAAYERAFGKPGTPEHDALIAETNELLKLTPEQQDLQRIRRRMRDDA